MNKIGWEYQTA